MVFKCGSKGIIVNHLCPGYINTDMIKQLLVLPEGKSWTMTKNDNLISIIKRYAEPEEFAASVAFLLGDKRKFVTNQ